jgi:hypothetical protein
MSEIGGINSSTSIAQSQLTSMQLGDKIAMAVAARTLDAMRQQGEAALSLLAAAVELAQAPQDQPTVVSHLGQNIDVQG